MTDKKLTPAQKKAASAAKAKATRDAKKTASATPAATSATLAALPAATVAHTGPTATTSAATADKMTAILATPGIDALLSLLVDTARNIATAKTADAVASATPAVTTPVSAIPAVDGTASTTAGLNPTRVNEFLGEILHSTANQALKTRAALCGSERAPRFGGCVFDALSSEEGLLEALRKAIGRMCPVLRRYVVLAQRLAREGALLPDSVSADDKEGLYTVALWLYAAVKANEKWGRNLSNLERAKGSMAYIAWICANTSMEFTNPVIVNACGNEMSTQSRNNNTRGSSPAAHGPHPHHHAGYNNNKRAHSGSPGNHKHDSRK
jgi:hypothetical protein